jgi:hypothetical protein
MIVFAAATGLRPGEWIALEHRDVDRDARVVYVRRAFAHGRLKSTKTRRSIRAVPLQSIALDALERLPARPPASRSPSSATNDRSPSSARRWRWQELTLPFDTSEELAEVAESILRQFPADEYPHLAETIVELTRSGFQFADEFEVGLDLILDGLERLRDTA